MFLTAHVANQAYSSKLRERIEWNFKQWMWFCHGIKKKELVEVSYSQSNIVKLIKVIIFILFQNNGSNSYGIEM